MKPNLFKLLVISCDCITASSCRRLQCSLLHQRGVPTWASPFTTWILPLKGPGAQHVRGSMKIPAEMAEQSGGVNLSALVPLWRHFDVITALGFVMWRSCQISGPVTPLSSCLLGLTEPVMELILNKRAITFPEPHCTTLLYGVQEIREHPSCLQIERKRRAWSSSFSHL